MEDAAGTATVLFGTLFGTGLLGALLRRWWKQQDNAFEADQMARAEERQSCAEQIAELRAQHVTEVEGLRHSFNRRFDAMAAAMQAMVDLVPEGDARTEAARILLKMSMEDHD